MFAKHWYLGEVWYITTKAVKPKSNIPLLFSHPWDNNAMTLFVIPAVCAGMVRDHITQPVKWMQYIIPLLTDVPQYFKPTERSFLKDTTWQGAKHYSGAALKGSFREYFDWLILISSWGTASWAFIAMSWYLGSPPFLLQVSLLPLSSFQERTTSQSKIGEMVAPDGWSQMANASSCTVADVTGLCFSPQTRNKQYCETLETAETKNPQYFTTHTALSAVPDLPPCTSQM